MMELLKIIAAAFSILIVLIWLYTMYMTFVMAKSFILGLSVYRGFTLFGFGIFDNGAIIEIYFLCFVGKIQFCDLDNLDELYNELIIKNDDDDE